MAARRICFHWRQGVLACGIHESQMYCDFLARRRQFILIDSDAVVCYKSELFHVVAHVKVSPRDTGDFPNRRNSDSADDDNDLRSRATTRLDYRHNYSRQPRRRDSRDQPGHQPADERRN
jgi:hypothetical protein